MSKVDDLQTSCQVMDAARHSRTRFPSRWLKAQVPATPSQQPTASPNPAAAATQPQYTLSKGLQALTAIPPVGSPAAAHAASNRLVAQQHGSPPGSSDDSFLDDYAGPLPLEMLDLDDPFLAAFEAAKKQRQETPPAPFQPPHAASSIASGSGDQPSAPQMASIPEVHQHPVKAPNTDEVAAAVGAMRAASDLTELTPELSYGPDFELIGDDNLAAAATSELKNTRDSTALQILDRAIGLH